jgi:hypothetical protein
VDAQAGRAFLAIDKHFEAHGVSSEKNGLRQNRENPAA